MNVRPISFSCTVNNDAPQWTPGYDENDYRNIILRAHGDKVDFCHVCAHGGWLSQATHAIVTAFQWEGDPKPSTSSENVCERHATDSFENFVGIGK